MCVDIIQKNQEGEKTQMSIKGQMDKLWYIHTTEYDWAIERIKYWCMSET